MLGQVANTPDILVKKRRRGLARYRGPLRHPWRRWRLFSTRQELRHRCRCFFPLYRCATRSSGIEGYVDDESMTHRGWRPSVVWAAAIRAQNVAVNVLSDGVWAQCIALETDVAGRLVAFNHSASVALTVWPVKGSCGFAVWRDHLEPVRSRTRPFLLCFIRRDGLCRPVGVDADHLID